MPVNLLSGLLRPRQAIVSSALAAVIVAAWAYLLRGTGIKMALMDMGGGLMMAMPPDWSVAYAVLIFVMWVVMMLAMMLPSAAPTILLVTKLASDRTANSKLVAATAMLFAIGYLVKIRHFGSVRPVAVPQNVARHFTEWAPGFGSHPSDCSICDRRSEFGAHSTGTAGAPDGPGSFPSPAFLPPSPDRALNAKKQEAGTRVSATRKPLGRYRCKAP